MGDETTRSGRGSPWQYLMPAEILVKVFEYITESEDWFNARATCHRWYEVSLLPQFWAKVLFYIDGDINGVRRTKLYMQRFGRHLKELSITFESFINFTWRRTTTTTAQCRNVFSELKEVLNTKQQLQSFDCFDWIQLQGFTLDRIPLSRTMIQRALSNLCNLLERQEHLSRVCFENFCLPEKEGCRVLRALATSNTLSQMINLNLRGFFLPWLTVCSMSVFINVMAQFKRLTRVGLNYYYLSDTVLENLISASPSLRRIYLYVDKLENFPATELSLPDWQKAVKKSPDLGVYVIIDVYKEEFEYQDFLLPGLPLVSLGLLLTFPHYTVDDQADVAIEREIASAISFTNRHRLKMFIVSWEMSDDTLEEQASTPVRNAWNRPEALVDIVKSCSSLSHFSMDVTLTLDTLMQMAAAALSRGGEEGEKGGASARSPLNIHVAGLDTDQERVMERLSAVNPLCKVQICSDFEYLLYRQHQN